MRVRGLALALLAAITLGGCQTTEALIGRTIRIEDEPLLAEPGASLNIEDVAQGDERILLNFWASWCVPCREEIPLFAEYAAREGGGGVLLGVLYKDAAGPGRAAADELGAAWPTLLDADGSLAAQIPVNAAPLTLLLDASGEVLDYRVGPFATIEEIDAFVSGE